MNLNKSILINFVTILEEYNYVNNRSNISFSFNKLNVSLIILKCNNSS